MRPGANGFNMLAPPRPGTAVLTAPARAVGSAAMPGLFVRLVAAAALCPAAVSVAWGAPAGEDADSLRALVETLEDDSRRAALIARLNALIAAESASEAAPASPFADAAAGKLAAAAAALETLRERAAAPGALAAVGRAAALLALALGVASLAGWGMRRLSAAARAALAPRAGDRFAAAALLAAGRAALAFAPAGAFLAAGGLAAAVTASPAGLRTAAFALVAAGATVGAAGAAARLVFAPGAGSRRPAPVGDDAAAAFVAWTGRLAAVAAFGVALGTVARAAGLSADSHLLYLELVGLAAAGLAVIAILRRRRPVAAALARGAPAGGLRARLAEFWHAPAALGVFAVWALWAVSAGGGAFLIRAAATAAVVAAALAAVAAARRAFSRDARVGAAVRRRGPGAGANGDAWADGLRHAATLAVAAAAVMLTFEIWIGGAFAWATSGSGATLAGRGAAIALTVLGALVAWRLISASIERAIPRASGGRLRTLLPLARNAARAALWAVAGLMVLSEIGIDIGPLLAGAGVAGIAVGFGAQSLVKDAITGVFILVEDSVAIGDVVDLGGHSGIVEGMTLRTVRLRDLGGDVHIVPFGEIGSVLNKSKEYSYALVEAGVAYGEDVDAVIATLRTVGEEVRNDPDYGADVLEPLHVLGLDSFGDSSVNIRVRLKTRPNRQWRVRREFHRRMKRAFDAAGIEIPFPHRTVTIARDDGAAPHREDGS